MLTPTFLAKPKSMKSIEILFQYLNYHKTLFLQANSLFLLVTSIFAQLQHFFLTRGLSFGGTESGCGMKATRLGCTRRCPFKSVASKIMAASWDHPSCSSWVGLLHREKKTWEESRNPGDGIRMDKELRSPLYIYISILQVGLNRTNNFNTPWGVTPGTYSYHMVPPLLGGFRAIHQSLSWTLQDGNDGEKSWPPASRSLGASRSKMCGDGGYNRIWMGIWMEIYGIYSQKKSTKRDVWVKIPSGNLVQFSMEAMMAQITSGYLGSMFEHGGHP